MISSTLQIQETKNNTTINSEREIEEDSNSGQVTSQNWWEGWEKRRGGISENKRSAMPCALHCYLIILFPPLVITICCNLLCFFICNWKMLLHVCTCALVVWGLSNKNNLIWKNMLACSYYFLMRVWQMQKSSSLPYTAPTVCLLH